MIRRGLMMRHKGGRLPSGYTEVEYIENNSNAYIDTKVIPNDSTGAMVKWLKLNNGKDAQVLSSIYNNIRFYLPFFSFNTITYGWNTYTNVSFNLDNNKHTTSLNYNNDRQAIFDGNTIATLNEKLGVSNQSLYMFRNTPSGHELVGKIYSCRITQEKQLVRDFIPCINPQNEVGMFDLVEQKFYGSASASKFIAGNPI